MNEVCVAFKTFGFPTIYIIYVRSVCSLFLLCGLISDHTLLCECVCSVCVCYDMYRYLCKIFGIYCVINIYCIYILQHISSSNFFLLMEFTFWVTTLNLRNNAT